MEIQTSAEARLAGLPDPEVLRIAAAQGRILISQDRRTMPDHFQQFVNESTSPGVIVLRKKVSIAAAIDEIVLIWSASDADEWVNRLVWIPL
jgi:hypothetical protein